MEISRLLFYSILMEFKMELSTFGTILTFELDDEERNTILTEKYLLINYLTVKL